ncbi:MAG: ABC transporter substrate-binding protein [Betaproteobacteria bacterium]|nr:ABC transporter substrate-binding protein [Betaproteobacteria bacterium]
MNWKQALIGLSLAAGALSAAAGAEPLKIGLILPMSGPFAAYGKQINHGVQLWLNEHGGTIAGRKVDVVLKNDAPGTAGDVDKRLAQELVIKDKVDILAGFALTPSAFAVAPLATQAKMPMVVMNAATSSITTKSPDIVRVSMTLPQGSKVIADWAAKNGIKKVFVLVADYGPGFDAATQFTKSFTGDGGTIVGDIKAPLSNPDYAPYLQRIKDAKPDAVFLFLPPGAGTIAFMKGFVDQGLAASGIKLIGTGDLTDEDILDTLGKPALGIITAFHYSAVHDSPQNKAFVAAYDKAYPKDRPNFMAVGGYDGMELIDLALKKDHGDATGPAFMAAVKGLHWTSPRGPVTIDPATRDIVQNEYIRKVEMVGTHLQNVEFETVPDVKDPGK